MRDHVDDTKPPTSVQGAAVATDDPQTAPNFIRLQKTQTGYTWAISVRALSLYPEGMQVALEVIMDVDERLQAAYGRRTG